MDWLWFIIGLDPLDGWGWAILIGIAILAVRYFTGSWTATIGLALAGLSLWSLARARKSGEVAHAKKVEKANVAFKEESKKIEKQEAKRTPAARRKRGSRFVHDD